MLVQVFFFWKNIDFFICYLLFRLTPMLLVVVFWYAFIMEHTGSGPQWNDIILGNADLCKSSAWMNLLYIQNFLPFEEEVILIPF